MKTAILIPSTLITLFAGSTVLVGALLTHSVDTARGETLGRYCQAGLASACQELVRTTNGYCAGPQGSGCLYDSSVTKPQ